MEHTQDPEALLHSWCRCWSGLGARRDGHQAYRQLIAAYDEPHRSYHTRQHLKECLSLFESHRTLAIEPDEVELSLWFHDAVYQVRAGDNEDQSAQWAQEVLRSAGVLEERLLRIRSLILATQHGALPTGQDQQLMVDIDLSILGAPADRFDAYEAQIRAEFRWVPDFLFRRKRRELLAGILARKPIYNTPQLRDLLESRARENLKRSIAALSGRTADPM